MDLAPWLAPGATTLTGPNVHAFADLNDDDFAAVGEETPISGGNFTYPLTPFGACVFTCTWDPAVSSSFSTNRNQNATQAFYFVNNFHDWLKPPRSASRRRTATSRPDGDPSRPTPTTARMAPAAFPTATTSTTRTCSPRPTARSRRCRCTCSRRASRRRNGGDAADIVYHEYTHGLSNRLVVDSLGNSTLNSPQAGAMGEAWSDWYAMDYLADPGLFEAERRRRDALVGSYVSTARRSIRSEPLDCLVGVAASPRSPGFEVPAGRLHLRRLRQGQRSPEVHADGEIWAQTLWHFRARSARRWRRDADHRRACTCPRPNPSFLDMRNAILQADVEERRVVRRQLHGARDQVRATGAPIAVRSCQSVCAQISPSACTSGEPLILPKLA